MSKHLGIVEYKFKDRVVKLQYNWGALSKIDADEELKAAIGDLSNNVKPSIIGRLFVIGCEAHNPEVDYDYLQTQSPPLFDCLSAINKALNYAYFGADDAPDVDGETENNKKKTG